MKRNDRFKGWRSTCFDQPRLQFVVDDDVVSVTLEAMPIVRHYRRHRFQRVHDAPRDVGEQLLRDRFTSRALQIQAQILHAQLAAVLAVILVLKFFDPLEHTRCLHANYMHNFKR